MKRMITSTTLAAALFLPLQLTLAGAASAEIPAPDAPFGSCAAYTCTDPLAYLFDLATGSAQ